MVFYWKRRRFYKNRYYNYKSRNRKWIRKNYKKDANKSDKRLKVVKGFPRIKSYSFLVSKKKRFPKNFYYLNYRKLNTFLLKKKQVENRLKLGQEPKNFWGSFIKKGIRYNKIYFYVLKKFRALTGKSVIFFYKLALEILRPIVYYKPRRFGAFIHLIPRMISKNLGFNLAKRFLVKAIRKRKEFYLGDRIINELLDVIASKSSAYYYKREVYSEVAENRVYMRRRRGKKSF